MADDERALQRVPRWNRQEVNRYLLPVLRYTDGERDGVTEDVARLAVVSSPEAYEQLGRVWRTGDGETLDKWFGQIYCTDEMLDAVFDFIDDVLGGEEDEVELAESYEKMMYFAAMFRIHDGERTVDLAEPFEKYYFCDEAIYKDCEYRRVQLGDECRAWIRRYLPYYNRIRSWYRENGEATSGVGHEYVAYMALYDHFRASIVYEDSLAEERQALEYERGGLGWFHRERKREIDAELKSLSCRELELRLKQANERYDAYEAQFESSRQAWLDELEHAPLTAFGRRRELKSKLSELEQRLEDFRVELGLDELQEQYRKIVQGKGN